MQAMARKDGLDELRIDELRALADKKLRELLRWIANYFRTKGLDVEEGEDRVVIHVVNARDEDVFNNAYEVWQRGVPEFVDAFYGAIEELRRKARELGLNVDVDSEDNENYTFSISVPLHGNCYKVYFYEIREDFAGPNDEPPYSYVFEINEYASHWPPECVIMR